MRPTEKKASTQLKEGGSDGSSKHASDSKNRGGGGEIEVVVEKQA